MKHSDIGNWEIVPARYAKNSILLKDKPTDGLKTFAQKVAESMNGRYTYRENGYVLPATKEAKLRAAIAAKEAEVVEIRTLLSERRMQEISAAANTLLDGSDYTTTVEAKSDSRPAAIRSNFVVDGYALFYPMPRGWGIEMHTKRGIYGSSLHGKTLTEWLATDAPVEEVSRQIALFMRLYIDC